MGTRLQRGRRNAAEGRKGRDSRDRKTRSDRDGFTGYKRRSHHFEGVTEIDFRDYNLLRKFITEHGKIMPARLTGATAKQQRRLAQAIRRARVIGLMP